MVTSEGEFIGKNGFGIPKSALDTCGTKRIRGGSGAELDVYVSRQELLFHAINGLRCQAFIVDRHPDTVGLDLRTKGYQGGRAKRHPDLFAREFTLEAYAYLKEFNSYVRYLRGYWLKDTDSDNTKMFMREYRKYRFFMRKKKAMEKAAKKTWTGKIAAELGLTEVKSIDMTSIDIEVFFGEPTK